MPAVTEPPLQEKNLAVITGWFSKSVSQCTVSDAKGNNLGYHQAKASARYHHWEQDRLSASILSWDVSCLKCRVCSPGSVSQEGLSGVVGDMGVKQQKGSRGWSNWLPKGDYKSLWPFILNKKNKSDKIRRMLGKLNAELLLTESLSLMKQEADWFKRKHSFTELIGNSCTLFRQRGWREAIAVGWEREKTNSWSAGL